MATSNSDEDENYWPGYVDALTTMTMVLTFIMMVLGVMVFVLSQESVSAKLGVLARALKIEARELEKLNQSEIEDALKRAVAMKETGDSVAPNPGGGRSGEQERVTTAVSSAPTPQAKPIDGDTGTSSAMASASASDGIITAPGLEPVGFPKGQSIPPITKPAEVDDRGQSASTFLGGMQGERTAGPGGEYLVTQQGTGVAGDERGVGSRLDAGPGALRFVFERGAIDLPPAVAEALQAYVAAEGAGPMIVEATAVVNEGGPTDARRKAYFRAMLIRSRLIKLGVGSDRIVVRVRDASKAAALEIVDVMKPVNGG